LYFQAATKYDRKIAFLMVGNGEQSVDFGVGQGQITTFDWTDNLGATVLDNSPVDGHDTRIDFARYRDGIVPGVLEFDEEPPEPEPEPPPKPIKWTITISVESEEPPDIEMTWGS